jgi:hypothetical protein
MQALRAAYMQHSPVLHARAFSAVMRFWKVDYRSESAYRALLLCASSELSDLRLDKMIWPEQDKHTPQMVAKAWKWTFTGFKEPPEYYVCRPAGSFRRFGSLAMLNEESFRLQPDGGQSRCAYLERPSV